MNTPNLDAYRAALAACLCHCRNDLGVTYGKATTRTVEQKRWLGQHATLCSQTTAGGQRRYVWQCNECLRNICREPDAVGRRAEPVPDFVAHGSHQSDAILAVRYARLGAVQSRRRAAWFADHNLYLQSAQWKALREMALRRDSGRCVRCGANASQVHHRTYERWQHENLDDLESLCRPCHELEHSECPDR